jgi:hypothetical protein
MKKHDRHYEEMAIQPIQVMEERMIDCHGADGPSTVQNLNLAIAMKHIMRAGKKEGQPWRKDIEKAQNYLHRALYRKWIEGKQMELTGIKVE